MKKIIYLLIPVILIVGFYVLGTNKDNYLQAVTQKQKERLHFLEHSAQSPVKDSKNFKHAGFFPINQKYKTTGKVTQNLKNQQFAIEMSSGKSETYLYYGDVNFELDNKKFTLVLFQHLENTNEFLLPFADLSNTKSTYGAGRYLPIQYNGGDNIELDFNLATNPYCAYNHDYSCPIPPKSNQLNIEILAGEKY
jgi:uncharacterized protein (DUF1684 family)